MHAAAAGWLALGAAPLVEAQPLQTARLGTRGTPDLRASATSAQKVADDHDAITGPLTTAGIPAPTRWSPWVAPLLSAVVPGAGQGLLRQQRGVVYAVAEGYLVVQALQSHRDASRQRDAYREIARSVARASFGGGRPDGEWSYYERLQFALESGAYNATPGSGFTPESDPTTFNGSMWQLARETFWRNPDVAPDPTSPEYQRAIEFYQRRAAGDDFLWSWRDAQIEQDLYRQTIDRANDASRRTRQMVGLLLANHALSLVDSYVSVRLRVFGGLSENGDQRVGLSGALPLPLPR